MTVSATVDRKDFQGDDVTVAFATTPLVFFTETDLLVYVITDATGASELQTLGVDYTVAGGDGSTGTVTMTTAPASTETLLIKRVVPATQLSDFVNNDAADAEVAEDALDKLTMLAQQAKVDATFPLRISDAETPTAALTVLPFDRASGVLGFDASKNLTIYDASSAVTESGNVTFLSGTGASATTIQAEIRSRRVRPEQFGAVGDGSTDDSAAFLAMFNTGKPSMLTPGITYRVNAKLNLTANVNMKGSGGKILCTNNDVFLDNLEASAIDYFVLDDVEIETNFAPRTTTTSNLIRVKGAGFVRIENCNLIGGDIYTENATDGNVIKNNRIFADNAVGDVEALYGIRCDESRKYHIVGNVVEGFITGGIKCGLPIGHPTSDSDGHFIITHNDVKDCAQDGIDIYAGGRRSIVANNIVHGTYSVGLNIKSEPLGGAGTSTSNAEHCAVTGNVVHGTGSLGMYLGGRFYAVNGNVLSGAFAEAAARIGVEDDDTETAYMGDIAFTGNVLSNSDAASGVGLSIYQNKNNVAITGNTFTGNGTRVGTGVLMTQGTTGSQTSIVGNSFRNLHFGFNIDGVSPARLSFTGNYLTDIDNVGQVNTGAADAWVCIMGNIAESIALTPLAGTINAAYIIRDNSWQKAGPVVQTSSIGNVGGGEDDLHTYTLPASTLTRDRQAIRIKGWGRTEGTNANPKTIKVYFGSQVILTTALTISQTSLFRFECEVIKTGTDTQSYTSQLLQNGTTTIIDVERGDATQDDGAAIIIKGTATVTDAGGGINNNDIILYGLLVEPINY